MTTFPIPYMEALDNSNLTRKQIAQILKISTKRLCNLISGRGKMDNKEFRDIKAFVNSINQKLT